MKTLLRKKWFRRLCQLLLVMGSLLVLAYAAINWWGGRMKRDAIAQMRAEGRPTSLAELREPLPRDEDNFAMIPVLVQAREEWWNDKTGLGILPPGEVRTRLAALGAPSLRKNRRFDGDGIPDLAPWKRELGLAGTNEECLAAYDLKFSDVIDPLRNGLNRPHAVSPLMNRRAAEPKFYPLSWHCGYCLKPLVEGLAFRAELAMQANRADIAHESLLIAIRLAELIRSEVIAIGQAYQIQLWVLLKPTLSRLLKSGTLDRIQLQAIKNQLGKFDPMRSSLREIDLGTLESFAVFEIVKKNGSDMARILPNLERQPMPEWAREVLRSIRKELKKVWPDGWYDANAAMSARERIRLSKSLGDGSDLRSWLRACDDADARLNHRSSWNQRIYPALEWCLETGDNRVACQLRNSIQQAITACDLEEFRVEHGRYPDRLVETASKACIDSINGQPFLYRPTEKDYLLYSVGIDGKDDGGVRRSSNPSTPADLVW
jgi:hypothetical protein